MGPAVLKDGSAFKLGVETIGCPSTWWDSWTLDPKGYEGEGVDWSLEEAVNQPWDHWLPVVTGSFWDYCVPSTPQAIAITTTWLDHSCWGCVCGLWGIPQWSLLDLPHCLITLALVFLTWFFLQLLVQSIWGCNPLATLPSSLTHRKAHSIWRKKMPCLQLHGHFCLCQEMSWALPCPIASTRVLVERKLRLFWTWDYATLVWWSWRCWPCSIRWCTWLVSLVFCPVSQTAWALPFHHEGVG